MSNETSNLWVSEDYLNATEGHGIGESGVYESFTADKGELYRSCQRQYGRCTSKVYVDAEGGPQSIGWVFVKRERYEDTGANFLQETWVTVHAGPPAHSVEYFYA